MTASVRATGLELSCYAPRRQEPAAQTARRHRALPAWSANPNRHRLARTGNRQLNCAIHRIAVTQLRSDPGAWAYLQRRISASDTKTEALRALKRRLSDIVYKTLVADTAATTARLGHAA